MHNHVSLPYGRTPYRLVLGRWRDSAAIVLPPDYPAARPVEALVEDALDAPVASEPLAAGLGPRPRVTVIVSDASRPDPRALLVRAVRGRLPEHTELTIAVANGTHGPCDLQRLALGDAAAGARVVNHDARDERALVGVGTTSRGTPVRVHRCAVDADLVIATGAIKPHYFAGYGAGIKAVFPGLGGERETRINHRLKAEPGARAGVVDGNPCREDLEEVADLLDTRIFLLDLVADAWGRYHGAVAGDVRAAFRAGVAACEPLFRVRAPRRSLVVASDALPVTQSLYQASKIAAAVAPLVRAGGTVVLAAECAEGTGPVDVVNRGIYDIGIAPRLPPDAEVALVSSLAPETVAATYCRPVATVEELLEAADEPPVILPRASLVLVEVAE